MEVEACEIFRDRSHEIDLVVLDMAMPRMSGLDCLAMLKVVDPDVVVIVCSGYAADTDELHKIGFTKFLQKPYRQAALAEAVATSLASRDSH